MAAQVSRRGRARRGTVGIGAARLRMRERADRRSVGITGDSARSGIDLPVGSACDQPHRPGLDGGGLRGGLAHRPGTVPRLARHRDRRRLDLASAGQGLCDPYAASRPVRRLSPCAFRRRGESRRVARRGLPRRRCCRGGDRERRRAALVDRHSGRQPARLGDRPCSLRRDRCDLLGGRRLRGGEPGRRSR